MVIKVKSIGTDLDMRGRPELPDAQDDFGEIGV
jgi:hypothetical protein